MRDNQAFGQTPYRAKGQKQSQRQEAGRLPYKTALTGLLKDYR
jgi:hypothetical protein